MFHLSDKGLHELHRLQEKQRLESNVIIHEGLTIKKETDSTNANPFSVREKLILGVGGIFIHIGNRLVGKINEQHAKEPQVV